MVRNSITFGSLMGAALIYGALLNHTYQPADTIEDIPQWPDESRLKVQVFRPILLAFAHPHCPCFITTLSELRAVSGQDSDLQICVVFASPDGAAENWHLGRNWDAAKAAGLDTVVDYGCIETRRFRASCSGELMLYKDGRCQFHGGITAGRGHSGPNAGYVELMRVINGFEPSLSMYPVFGCPLFNEGSKN